MIIRGKNIWFIYVQNGNNESAIKERMNRKWSYIEWIITSYYVINCAPLFESIKLYGVRNIEAKIKKLINLIVYSYSGIENRLEKHNLTWMLRVSFSEFSSFVLI